VARRESYQDVINRDRDRMAPAAERASPSARPPEARRGYKRRAAIDADLARYYEQCKRTTRGRFKSSGRQKQYCAAVAWKRVEQTGRFPDYPTFAKRTEPDAMPRRNPRTGRFVKGSGKTSRGHRSSEAGRRTSGRAGEHRVSGYTYKRGGKTVRVRPHMSRETPRTSRSSGGSRSRPKRSSGRRSAAPPPNIAIVRVGGAGEARGRGKAYSPRRYKAREPVMAGAGRVTLLVTGVTLGFMVADAIDRYLAGVPSTTAANTLPAPYASIDNPIPKYNNDVVSMKPSLTRIAAQMIPAIVLFLLGGVTKGASLKFFLYGLGGGFTVHFVEQIVTAYVIVPMVSSSTGTGQQMYQHEINAYNAIANPSGGYLGAGPANRPGAYGRRHGLMGAPPQNSAAAPPPALPANQPARVPVVLATQPTPQPAAAPAAQQQAAMMGQPPAQQPAAAPQAAPAPTPNGQSGPHPVWAALLERQAA
jgi:hypothetical protein